MFVFPSSWVDGWTIRRLTYSIKAYLIESVRKRPIAGIPCLSVIANL